MIPFTIKFTTLRHEATHVCLKVSPPTLSTQATEQLDKDGGRHGSGRSASPRACPTPQLRTLLDGARCGAGGGF